MKGGEEFYERKPVVEIHSRGGEDEETIYLFGRNAGKEIVAGSEHNS